MTKSKGISSTVGIMLLVALVIIMFSLSAFILFTNLGTSNETPSPSAVDTNVNFQIEGEKLLVTPSSFEEPVEVRANGNPVGTIESPADTVVVNLDRNNGTNVRVYTMDSNPILAQQLVDATADGVTISLDNSPNRVVGMTETFSVQDNYDTITWSVSGGANILNGQNSQTMKLKYTQQGSVTITVEVEDNQNNLEKTKSMSVNVQKNPSSGGGVKIEKKTIEYTKTIESNVQFSETYGERRGDPPNYVPTNLDPEDRSYSLWENRRRITSEYTISIPDRFINNSDVSVNIKNIQIDSNNPRLSQRPNTGWNSGSEIIEVPSSEIPGVNRSGEMVIDFGHVNNVFGTNYWNDKVESNWKGSSLSPVISEELNSVTFAMSVKDHYKLSSRVDDPPYYYKNGCIFNDNGPEYYSAEEVPDSDPESMFFNSGGTPEDTVRSECFDYANEVVNDMVQDQGLKVSVTVEGYVVG